MLVSVITPPEPIVFWEQARAHLRLDDGDEQPAYVEDLVAVATAWLDGPGGWLGRALGEQTLEAVFPVCGEPAARCYPFPPFLALVSDVPAVDGATTTVRWRAGYEAGKVPAPVRHAVLLMVSHLFNNRDAVSTTAAQPAQLPLGVEALLSPYRVWSV
ncbi:head-tail connector protein [Methylobacterium brachiatum]|uniref:head-tail connector protein n=1 Tax=Methylobacterium brachiatum TaxID=269660 RepID=UPI000EFCD663|nr:head-tail connector protein [Methylobacterium brachiatum]AYO83661.1 phage gp6-like head-tail connector protein [Methylobacterium brachiatum]